MGATLSHAIHLHSSRLSGMVTIITPNSSSPITGSSSQATCHHSSLALHKSTPLVHRIILSTSHVSRHDPSRLLAIALQHCRHYTHLASCCAHISTAHPSLKRLPSWHARGIFSLPSDAPSLISRIETSRM